MYVCQRPTYGSSSPGLPPSPLPHPVPTVSQQTGANHRPPPLLCTSHTPIPLLVSASPFPPSTYWFSPITSSPPPLPLVFHCLSHATFFVITPLSSSSSLPLLWRLSWRLPWFHPFPKFPPPLSHLTKTLVPLSSACHCARQLFSLCLTFSSVTVICNKQMLTRGEHTSAGKAATTALSALSAYVHLYIVFLTALCVQTISIPAVDFRVLSWNRCLISFFENNAALTYCIHKQKIVNTH